MKKQRQAEKFIESIETDAAKRLAEFESMSALHKARKIISLVEASVMKDETAMAVSELATSIADDLTRVRDVVSEVARS